MDYDFLLKLISQVGFPIFVALYLLIRMERVLVGVMETLTALKHSIDLLAARIHNEPRGPESTD